MEQEVYWNEMSYNKYNYNSLSDRFNQETEFDVEFDNMYKEYDIIDDIVNWEE